jgi:hypothetical protein
VATVPAEHLVTALVRHLADAVGGQVTYRAPNEMGELAVVAAWPPDVERQRGHVVERAAGVWTERAAEAGSASERVSSAGREDAGYRPANAERQRGHVTERAAGVWTVRVVEAANAERQRGHVTVFGPRRWGDAERAMHREVAGWIGTAAAVNLLRADRDRARARARSLRAEMTAARERFAEVRELERHRLVRAITTTTLADLDHVRQRLRRLGESLPEQRSDAETGGLAEVRDALDELLDNFRTVVRGVYPSMLPDRGPRAALEELAATLRGPVRFRGDLGRRVEWQVESGLYHAVAAVLNTVAGGENPITVDFHRDDALRVRIGAPAGGLSADELRTALDYDVKRLAVLGGWMDCSVSGGSVVVTIRLAERLELVGAETPPVRFEHSAFYRRVWELVRQGQQASAGGPDRSRWDAVAARLAGPARLVVVRDPATDPVSAAEVAHASALNVTVVDAEGPAEEALARELLADDGPRGSTDAVLCLVPPAPAFRAALRAGTQRVVLSESASPVELARTLVARGPVIAARRAMVAVRDLMSRLPADHSLWWSFDRIGAEAHEIAELDLLDELERGDPRLLRSVDRGCTADALQLLGARGTDPRARLGLAVDAADVEVRAAASGAVELWRSRAERPATGGRDRAACEVLVRTAEGLFSGVRTL